MGIPLKGHSLLQTIPVGASINSLSIISISSFAGHKSVWVSNSGSVTMCAHRTQLDCGVVEEFLCMHADDIVHTEDVSPRKM